MIDVDWFYFDKTLLILLFISSIRCVNRSEIDMTYERNKIELKCIEIAFGCCMTKIYIKIWFLKCQNYTFMPIYGHFDCFMLFSPTYNVGSNCPNVTKLGMISSYVVDPNLKIWRSKEKIATVFLFSFWFEIDISFAHE